MKKIAYILGSLEIILGLLIVVATSLLKEAMPMLGRVAYQAAAAGGYSASNYQMSCTIATAIAVVLIVAGAVQLVCAFYNKK